MNDLIGKKVEVITPETIYTGKLMEMNENEVYLEAETGWIVISIERVISVKEV